jgi:hypothetical protein
MLRHTARFYERVDVGIMLAWFQLAPTVGHVVCMSGHEKTGYTGGQIRRFDIDWVRFADIPWALMSRDGTSDGSAFEARRTPRAASGVGNSAKYIPEITFPRRVSGRL